MDERGGFFLGGIFFEERENFFLNDFFLGALRGGERIRGRGRFFLKGGSRSEWGGSVFLFI